MTKDDFQACAGNKDKTETTTAASTLVHLPTRLMGAHMQGPRAPAPRGLVPKAPFGMHLMPMASSIKILPSLVPTTEDIPAASATDGKKDEK